MKQKHTVKPILPLFTAYVTVIIIFFIGLIWLFRGFFVDDSFITFRYVQQFTNGNGLVYNIGERVEGYSNFLWVMLLAPIHAAGFDLIIGSKLLGAGLSIGCIVALAWFSRELDYAPTAPLLLAVSTPFVAWTMGGLETSLFAFLLVVSTICFITEERQQRGWLSSLGFSLLALTRPEGLMFAGIAVLYRAWQRYRERQRPHRDDLIGLAILALVILSFYAWRLSYYGYLLPNTVYAKSMGLFNLRPWLEGGLYVYNGFAFSGGLIGVALLGSALLSKQRPVWSGFVATNVGAYFFFMWMSGGDWMAMHRFWAQISPLLCLLMHAGLVTWLKYLDLGRWRSVAGWGLVGLCAGYLLFGTIEQRFINGIGRGNASFDVSKHPMVAHLRANLTPQATIAVDLAGILAYGLPLDVRVVDVNGLADKHIAHRKPQFPNGLFGRGDGFGKWDVDYVLAQSPSFIHIGYTGTTADGRITTLNTGQTLLANDPRFRAQYRMVEVAGINGLFERIAP